MTKPFKRLIIVNECHSYPFMLMFDNSATYDTLGLNKSQVIFANIIKKRKRDDSVVDEHNQDGKSPMRKVRKRLDSFSDTGVKPLESTHLGQTAHGDGQGSLGHQLDVVNLSSIPNFQNKTPVKNLRTPSKKFMAQDEDFFSPSKKVIFNLKPQPPTPKSGVAARSILKTPSKDSPNAKEDSPNRSITFKTPSKTPSKVSRQTPSKVVSRLMMSPTVPQSPLATHCSSRYLTELQRRFFKDFGEGR